MKMLMEMKAPEWRILMEVLQEEITVRILTEVELPEEMQMQQIPTV